MIDEQKRVRDWMIKAQQETPATPAMPSVTVRELRVKLIAEELLELCEAFGLRIAGLHNEIIAFKIKEVRPDALEKAYDAVCDLLVVVLGTAVAIGCEAKPGFDEVMRSNESKFIDGTIRNDGKYLKGPSYSEARLKPIIENLLLAAAEHNRQPSLSL